MLRASGAGVLEPESPSLKSRGRGSVRLIRCPVLSTCLGHGNARDPVGERLPGLLRSWARASLVLGYWFGGSYGREVARRGVVQHEHMQPAEQARTGQVEDSPGSSDPAFLVAESANVCGVLQPGILRCQCHRRGGPLHVHKQAQLVILGPSEPATEVRLNGLPAGLPDPARPPRGMIWLSETPRSGHG